MKKYALLLIALGFLGLSGCGGSLASLDLYHDEPLRPQQAADRVVIRSKSGRPIPVAEITDPEQVARIVDFVNALPNKWNVPWENAPVGKIYFTFHWKHATIGNFFIGPNFFGREINNSYSQPATEAQILALGEIAGFDVWEAVGGPAYKAATPPKK